MPEEPTHHEQIRAIRALQREAASVGKPLSVTEAREALKQRVEKHDPAGDIAALGLAIASLKAELESVKSELAKFRITGVGFSGEGPSGIMFTADSLPLDEAPPAEDRIPLAVKEESSVVVTDCTTLQIVGKRTIAEEGATVNTAKVTIGVVAVTEDESARCEALKTLNFVGGNEFAVSSETANPGAETGLGDVTVTIPVPGTGSSVHRIVVTQVVDDEVEAHVYDVIAVDQGIYAPA